MTLLAVRNKFIELSGRDDLLGGSVDAGPDWFINAGQRLLDRLSGLKESAKHFGDISVGQILVPITDVRAIKRCYVYDSEKRTLVEKADINELREYYDKPKSEITGGKYKYYSPTIIRTHPADVAAIDYQHEWALDDVITTGSYAYNGLLFMPPADQIYTIEVIGLFYTDKLEQDNDSNHWTELFEDTLVQAALYKLEVVHRNSEGARDWMNAITIDLISIEMDLVEEEIADIDGLGG